MTGKMQHRMSVQSLGSIETGWEDAAENDWQTLREEMFQLKPTKAAEIIDGQRVQSQTTHDAKCHFFQGAKSQMRLKFGERIFNVESVVNEFERNRFLLWQLIEVN